MARVDSARGGFTLIEIVTALTIGALIVGVAHAMLVSVGDGAALVASTTVEGDRDANRERLLRALVYGLHASVDGDKFEGSPERARFASWCETPNGWLEQCEVELAFAATDSGSELVVTQAVGSARRTLTVAEGFQRGVLRYLSDARYGGSWMHIWGASITVPLAIGVVLDRDTTLLRIGGRG